MDMDTIQQIKKERLDVEELKKMYGLKSERTLCNWKKTKGFPMVEITPQQKYVYVEDLIEWERSFI